MNKSTRDNFHLPEGSYLLSHSVGCMPVTARSTLSENFLTPWEQSASHAWEHWLKNLTSFNQALSDMFHSPLYQFCPQANLSSALSKILSSLPAPLGRNRIVLSETDFPSMGFVIQQFCLKLGFEPMFLPADTSPQDLDAWSDVLSDKVYVALITHVQSNNSQMAPVQQITEMCRQRGIYSIVDVAQSAGNVPIDLTQWHADFMIGSCVKWLCGGPGSGFLWADESVIDDCEPVDVGWFSHQNPLEMDIHHFQFAEGVRRFAGGTPSIMPFTLAAESIQTLNRFGIKTIRQHNQSLIDRMTAGISVGEIVSPIDTEQRGGTLVINFDDNQRVLDHLLKEGIYCDKREEGIRFSPHIYNSTQDVDRLIEQLNSLPL